MFSNKAVALVCLAFVIKLLDLVFHCSMNFTLSLVSKRFPSMNHQSLKMNSTNPLPLKVQ